MVVWFFLAKFLFFYNGAQCDNDTMIHNSYSYETATNGINSCETTYFEYVQKGVIDVTSPEERQKPNSYNDDDLLKFRLLKGEVIYYDEAKYTMMYGRVCSGTILHKYWAITSAHCGFTESIVYAASDFVAMTNQYTVCAHFAHYEYNARKQKNWMDYDIQLLLMERAFEDTVTPVRIDDRDIYASGKKHTVLTAWGTDYPATSPMESDGRLRKLDMYLIEKKDCPAHPELSRPIICVGNPNVTGGSACFGDSGGPATVDGQLIGIIAWTPCKEELYTQLINVVTEDVRVWLRYVSQLAWV